MFFSLNSRIAMFDRNTGKGLYGLAFYVQTSNQASLVHFPSSQRLTPLTVTLSVFSLAHRMIDRT